MTSEEVEEEDVYADYARKHLAHRVLEAPSLYLAQSLVMISFYEWGSGRPYQAWMYSGKHQTIGSEALLTIDRNGYVYDTISAQNVG
jgi:hypothetical protein